MKITESDDSHLIFSALNEKLDKKCDRPDGAASALSAIGVLFYNEPLSAA